jgi:asparagine synthase (glutamine-hydrolysing)
LARDAFSDRLPSAIYKRRSKGELGALYGASIVDALDKIRPFLLEGRLRHHDLIIAKALAPILNEDVLAQDGGYIEILRAVALEAWVRHWEARLATIASLPRPVAQAGV